MGDTKVVVCADGVNLSLLTRKNLTNHTDIKADTLFRNAKAVEVFFIKDVYLIVDTYLYVGASVTL